MSRPTRQEIADALGIGVHQVSQLGNRGMPLNKIKKAREWFDVNGFNLKPHSKAGVAESPIPFCKILKSVSSGR
jgi:hypothetical protein